MNPTLKRLADPSALDGIDAAAEVVLSTVKSSKKIVVFGDYDCDGISASAILMRMFRALGANASAFIPDRLKEGYGMKSVSISRMLAENPDVGLVVTVDNGVGAISEVASLKDRGVAVVVTDHHLPTVDGQGCLKLPEADALVNPKVASPKSMDGLCGAGVAFLLANRIMSRARACGMYSGPNVGGAMLVLAGLSTVTDIMPLTGQNRIFVAEALRLFPMYAPQGLKELYNRAQRSGASRLTSRVFGFMLGPRINAAGRMASGMEALELLLSEDRENARELARRVDVYNAERKAIEQRMTEAAMQSVDENASAQVIELKDGHLGIIGIVASRVLESLKKKVPVCVIADGRGSARSPDGINIYEAFGHCSQHLEVFGGHAAAGGFTVKQGKVGEFRKSLCDYCSKVQGEGSEKSCGQTEPDLWIEKEDLTVELAEAIMTLEPFGEGNAEPVFGVKGVYISDVKPMGMEGKHLSLTLRGSGIRAVMWNRGGSVEELRHKSSGACDIVFTLVISDWGERHIELKVVALSWN